MATLLEINTIEVNSVGDPGSADQAVIDARALRAKVRAAILKRAGTIMGTALPTDATRSDALELLAWAQKAVAQPDAAAATVLRLVLASNATATTAQILGASDAAIEGAIAPALALLAKGLHPGT